MKRAFRTRTLGRWMRKAGLAERHLCQALGEMIDGLIDADLGGNVVKKRVALPGKGKRGGARIIVATRLEDRWFVIFGFGKNERDDIGKDELKALRELAADLLALDDRKLAIALRAGEITEICHGGAQEPNPWRGP